MKTSIAVMVFLLAAPAALAGGECSGGVCVEPDNSGLHTLTLVAANSRKTDVFVKVWFTKSENLFVKHSYARLVPAGGKVIIVRAPHRDTNAPIDYRYRFEWKPGDPDARHDDSYLYAVPVHYMDGAPHPPHIAEATFEAHSGDEVIASRAGIVMEIENRALGALRMCTITLRHSDGTYAEYRFTGSATVKEGQSRRRGNPLGIADGVMELVSMTVWRGAKGKAPRESLSFRVDDSAWGTCVVKG
jgi:hypothetical protein